MPNSHDNVADRAEDHAARLDVPAQVERSWSGVGLAGGPLTIRAQIRIVTGGQARAVSAAQDRALLALLDALAELTVPRVEAGGEEAG